MNRLSPENVLAGWRPGPAESRHVSRIFVDTLRPWLGEVANIPLPRIAVAPEDQNAANQWLDGRDWPDGHAIVAVHPGAGNLDKRWSGYAALVEQLACQGGYRVVVIEGPAEPGSGAVVRRRLPSDRVAVASSLSLELLAGVLSRCAGYIGNDSGISHLAAGLGVTSVVLFGPTAPGIWGPLGGHVEILRDTRGCRACDNPSSPEHRCLDNIRPEAVLERFAACGRAPPADRLFHQHAAVRFYGLADQVGRIVGSKKRDYLAISSLLPSRCCGMARPNLSNISRVLKRS